MTAKNIYLHEQRNSRLQASRDTVSRSLRRSSFFRHAVKNMVVASYQMLASIKAELAPKLQAVRDAESYAANGTKCENQGYVNMRGCSSLSLYSRSTGDDGDGMADNNTLWSAGHALASRDASKA